MSNEAYRKEATHRIMGVICETGRGEGSRQVLVSSEILVDEFCSAIALLLHNSPEAETPEQTTALVAELATRIARRVSGFRAAASDGALNAFRTPPTGSAN